LSDASPPLALSLDLTGKIPLTLYRILLSLFFPALVLALLVRRFRGQETAAMLAERLGNKTRPRPAAPIAWLHAASNGELTSARQVVQRLLAEAPDLHIVVTTNTATGRNMALGWRFGRVTVAMAPLDHRLILRRFLNHWQPKALIMVENELWPNRFALCAARAIPVLFIGARISAKSARIWSVFPGLAGPLLAPIRFLSAQDAASEARFSKLGLPAAVIGPQVNLKSAVTVETPGASSLVFPRAVTLLAASTHEGEEALVLDAFAAAQARIADLRLILAPRHPRRRDAVEAAIAARGLAFATRSRGDAPARETLVYLADTMGEMALWYSAAAMTFVGGSLADYGGHTPFEPASQGSVILHGPHVSNFTEAYQALAALKAAIPVTDASDLAAALVALADDPAAQTRLTVAANTALLPLSDHGGLAAFYTAFARETGISCLQTHMA
jgi:3-deoxy-D-manno-octulosonic-acid transferase